MTRALALLLAVLVMLTNSAWRRRHAARQLSEMVESSGRYVDAGIVLRVVVADLDGEQLIEGHPLQRVIREHRFGGMIDTKAKRPHLCGPSRDPVEWFCSEDQEPVILHRDDEPLGQLVYGSEGAGKTVALAMWHALRWLEHLGEGREGGQTAPTGARLDLVLREMLTLWPPSWFRYRIADELFLFCDGTRLRFKSTHQQSAATGAPIQGNSWSWCGGDEAQDQVGAHEDITSRGRAAKNGRYKQLRTATAKDSYDWRTLRDRMLDAKLPGGEALWVRRSLLIARSPFVSPDFLAMAAATMSPREFRRRMEAVDLPPELATYGTWSREQNLIRIPEIGWTDVTALELAKWGQNLTGLVGHDPGQLFDVSLLFKAFRVGRAPLPFWVAIDEVTTEQTTSEQHVVVLLERLRREHRMNLIGRDGRTTTDGPRVLVRADPYGNNDSKPDQATYTIFRNAGITIRPAAYSTVDPTKPGRVPKDAGIEVINTLLCNAAEQRRLYVAKRPDGSPAAPGLVKAFESAERDLYGKAETQRKDRKDMSHWPAAARYAFWQIERPRLHKAQAHA